MLLWVHRVEHTSNSARAESNIIVDTPVQIEVFNWSASGQIILDLLALSFPVVTSYSIESFTIVFAHG